MKTPGMKYLVGSVLVSTLAIGVIATTVLAKETKDKAALEAKARVSRADAEKAALAEVPGGKIKDAELEEEDGVLLWSFDITVPGSKKLKGIEVDAITGKIHPDKVESAEDEKNESGKEKDDDDDKDD